MKNSLQRLRSLAAVLLSSVLAVSFASAQEWPTKPIRIIVPAPPGAITDGVARLIGEQLRVNLGQPVIIDNKPGGSAVIAERAMLSAPADGYTLMVAPSSVWTDFPFSVKTPFDPHKTFTYVADVASMVHVLVASNTYPPNKPQEILDHARKNKNTVSVANMSTGTRSNLLGDLLSEKSGKNILVVPYKGSAPVLVDLMGGQVQLTFDVLSNVAPLVKAGKIKGVGIVSATRSPHLPDVPSFAELGMPDLVMPDASVGVMILSSTPPAMSERIRREMEKVMRSPKFREMMAAQGYDQPKESTFEELQKKLADTVEQNRQILVKLKMPTTPQ
ncbi:tripartite tricarboxylate transporter substrate binding protein [Acidovorax sp. Be4]|uniref:Tripartite tricarboxylate transporter substrate binding protein n=1 Tax=Acidovorax bellezanensis TaxID=2976702 RepID=A0ABT2PLV3_9BURK|nr:tripartite tricarboxylate transporter substrate binding protein [Acidovorax sp. Be4]MCT9811220.1 tripartite tricarboxylate transporter substrate binding protein [Acidovorax sp. Be4]